MKPEITDIVLIRSSAGFSVGVITKIRKEKRIEQDAEHNVITETETFESQIFGSIEGNNLPVECKEEDIFALKNDYASKLYSVLGFIVNAECYKRAEEFSAQLKNKMPDYTP